MAWRRFGAARKAGVSGQKSALNVSDERRAPAPDPAVPAGDAPCQIQARDRAVIQGDGEEAEKGQRETRRGVVQCRQGGENSKRAPWWRRHCVDCKRKR